MIREIINNYLEDNIKNKESVAILYSGGMDSLSILLSCLDLGINPILYTFYLDSYESEDLIASRKIAKAFNLQLNEIQMVTSIQNLTDDVNKIIKEFKVYRKTAVQCIHPFIYVFPEIKEEYVITGLCADDLYGSSKNMSIMSKDMCKFNQKRIELYNDETTSSYSHFNKLAQSYNKKFIAPYKECLELYEYFMTLNYKEMHSPKQKNIVYEDYKNELVEYSLYRRNSNLQCNSKLREYHDMLLDTKLNINNSKIVTPIYKRIYESYLKEE